MGQKSQIYIKWDVRTYNNEHIVGAIARYFEWNYGERMISRARGIIEELNDEYMNHTWIFNDDWYKEKLIRIAETNFDMRDIVPSQDIFKEYEEFKEDDSFEDTVFYGQDNNDGQLFISVTDSGIKYALALEYDKENGYKPINAEQYMKENMGDWRTTWRDYDDDIQYTEDNIKYISENAELMTAEEIADFIESVRNIYEYESAPKF